MRARVGDEGIPQKFNTFNTFNTFAIFEALVSRHRTEQPISRRRVIQTRVRRAAGSHGGDIN